MIQLNADDKKWVDRIWECLDNKLSKTAVDVYDFVPYSIHHGKYMPLHISWWTNGFYGGMLWLMYKMTGKDVYKRCAVNQERIMDRALEKYDGLSHDVGFQWDLLSKPHYELEGNKESRVRALYAANLLAARANIRGKFIRAWDKRSYSIIDCMMNLPLLYWASRELEDDRFRFIAEMHADMAMRDHVREDGSVVHIVVHDEQEDRVIETLGGQGMAAGSAWTRGQAWAVYGFILSYIHTGKREYLDTAIKVSDYFLERTAEFGYRTPTDFMQPKEIGYIDSSAGMCTACGLIELYRVTKEEKYLDGAIKILKAHEQDYIFDDSEQSIVQNGMHSYTKNVQMHLIYADFYFVEAIAKLKGMDYLIW